jgi:1L-myo-inositol 1-phosphate cytidylyltransferase / CDP-L-myo-inositol myo-inositolphosphotransferase
LVINIGDFDIVRSINRVLARPFTGFFIRSALHPNQITLLSASSGAAAALLFCLGTKAGFISGAALFELFYILDNCDGEVARAKGLSTKFGSWLDTSVDYCAHVAAFGGIAFGIYRTTQSPLIFIAGVAAMTGIFLSFFVVVLQKTKNYGLAIHGMPKTPEGMIKKASALDKLIETLSVGDFSIIVLLFALFGKMELLLWLAAFGANLFCIVLLITNFKYLVSDCPPSCGRGLPG